MNSGIAKLRWPLLVRILISAVISCAPCLAPAQGNDGGTAAEPGKAGGAVLTVVVRGGGQPVEKAEVKVTCPPGSATFLLLPSDATGTAEFKVAKPDSAMVRVVATGWLTAWKKVALKPGVQELVVDLEARKND